MDGINIKGKIERNVRQAVQEFEAREDVTTKFGEPVIAYIDARDTIFNLFFDKHLTEHPKNIYRPGITLIVYFSPFADDIAKGNIGGKAVSDEWRRATIESAWLSMKLNRVIRQTMDIIGRLSSILNTQLDWNEKTCWPEWSHKLAAYAAGMGELGPAGPYRRRQLRMSGLRYHRRQTVRGNRDQRRAGARKHLSGYPESLLLQRHCRHLMQRGNDKCMPVRSHQRKRHR